jgi:hypothetical protein
MNQKYVIGKNRHINYLLYESLIFIVRNQINFDKIQIIPLTNYILMQKS